MSFVTLNSPAIRSEYVPGRLLVKLSSVPKRMSEEIRIHGGTSKTYIDSVDKIIRRHGILSVEYLYKPSNMSASVRQLRDQRGINRWLILHFPRETDIPKVAQELLKENAVEFVEPDYIGFGLAKIPNDTLFELQWALNNEGQTGGKQDADIDAPEAWELLTNVKEKVIIAVLDTGVNVGHPDLKDRIIGGYDFVNSDPDPSDDHGHGTAVVGIIGAVTDNNAGIAGACNDCKIMPIKVLDSSNKGQYSWWAEGMMYALEHGAKVINLSLGGTEYSRSLKDVVDTVIDNNVVIIAATGNFGEGKLMYPAAFDNVIAVGATDMYDNLWDGSNYGSKIDVVAPGVDIITTGVDGEYSIWTGTSVAAPHVSSIAGMLLSIKPDMNPAQIDMVIKKTSDDRIGDSGKDKLGWDEYYGYGRVNAHDAIDFILHNELKVKVKAIAGQGGRIEPSGDLEFEYGSKQTFTLVPDEGYHVLKVTVDGSPKEIADGKYLTLKLTNDCEIIASFEKNTYIIKAGSTTHGKIEPSGNIKVDHGKDLTFNITPDFGYQISDVLIDGISVGKVTTYTFTNVTSPHEIYAKFIIITYSIEASAGPNGTVSPSGTVKVNHGSKQKFTVTPAKGYHILDVLVDGISQGPINTYTFSNVTSNHTISATFEINRYSITAESSENGTITPSGTVFAEHGSELTFTITPNTGYQVADVIVDGKSKGALESYTFKDISSDHTIKAFFERKYYTIKTIKTQYGTIEPSGSIKVAHGADQSFSITPNEGYKIHDVQVDKESVGPVDSYTFVNVTTDHTISATFKIKTFVITATSGENGSISPSGQIVVNYGSNQKFTAKPKKGYSVKDIVVDGVSLGNLESYTFEYIKTDHTIHAIFAPLKGDLNGDGSVKSDDAIMILHISVGLLQPTERQLIAGDVNDDGKIGVDDAILALRKAVTAAPEVSNYDTVNFVLTCDPVIGTVDLSFDEDDMVTGGIFIIEYDSSVYRLTEVNPSNDVISAHNLIGNGLLKVAFLILKTGASGKFLSLRFEGLADEIKPMHIKVDQLYATPMHVIEPEHVNIKFTIEPSFIGHSDVFQNYPNPFNPETWIPYQLESDSHVIVQIFDICGRVIRRMDLGQKSAGSYLTRDKAIHWDGKNDLGEPVSSGIYFYSVQINDRTFNRKMIIQR